MLSTLGTLKGYILNGMDEELGVVDEFYFDDRYWTLRYLIVDAGTWLTGRQVLISPYAVQDVIHHGKLMSVDLTRKQVRKSPALDTDQPVSGQFEEAYYGYYGWPMYWDGPQRWGSYDLIEREHAKWKKADPTVKPWDRHLRSSQEVSGYAIEALDGELGHVEDFVIDEETWAIRYVIVATRNWWPGKKVLVSPEWIERVGWSESKVFINLTREAIRQSPEFTPESLLSRDYEEGLHRHYQRRGYWMDELAAL
ncbi:MAG TPA: PRC-barrel domain-containing protein [Gemmatimonadales bacterium]|nr:PRC-barrel domain-containing protein [Gemmatimonadales bacterium]